MRIVGSRDAMKRRSLAACYSTRQSFRPRLVELETRLVPSGLSLVGHWDNGTAEYSDGWAMTQNGRDYAYIGHFGNENGIHIIDITDPTQPNLISNFKSPSGWNDFRDVQTVKRGRRAYGFFASDSGGGLVIANVTNPANPVEACRITSLQGGADNVHTISIDGNYLYEADARTPIIRVFDITNPANPKFIRLIVSATDSVHEVTALNGQLYAAGISTNPLVEIFDITQVANLSQPISPVGTVFSGGKTHTAWPTADGQFIAVPHEKQGEPLSFWNISNPNNPQLAWEIALPTAQAYSPHQAMIIGDRLYASWYQAGVFVYDISDRYNPVLLGNYDTYSGTLGGYHGAWGVFPFLGDDRILGFDIESGLYILALDGPEPAPSVTPRITWSGAEEPVQLVGGVVRIVLSNQGQTTQISQDAATGTIDVALDGKVYQFNIPDVLRLNVYGGDGDDRFVLDRSMTRPVFLDGGGGMNRVRGWPGSKLASSKALIDDHCVDVTGVPREQHFEARNIQLFEDVASQALALTAYAGHVGHGTGLAALNATGSTIVPAEHAMARSGLLGGDIKQSGYNMVQTMGALHASGVIAPEFMLRGFTNSQVGGQVAYHKLG